MPGRATADRVTGLLLAAITLLTIFRQWHASVVATAVLPWLTLAVLAIFAFEVPRSRKAFLAVGVAIAVALVSTRPDWRATLEAALLAAAFIAAFFSALATLRTVAQSSPAIQKAGRYLSGQEPGLRYLALTAGGQMFALLLNYGAIQLLGTLALVNAAAEKNAEVRVIRIRRMLLAIQRGFISVLPWSPLSFAVLISTSVVPDTSWAQVVVPGIVTSLIVAGIGYGMDTIFKPQIAGTRVRTPPEGTWHTLTPLFFLLGLLVVSVTVLHLATGVAVGGVVAAVVPSIALGWVAIQHGAAEPPLEAVRMRGADYLFRELPAYRGELTLLMMAGFIGTAGSHLLAPAIATTGLDLAALPTPVILVAFVWLIPIAGQIGMNPILAVTLIAPLIPSAAALGVAPTAIVVAITSGWAISGASSPFTATTLLTGSFGGVSATHVGIVWNGTYTLICATVLSAWVLVYAYLV